MKRDEKTKEWADQYTQLSSTRPADGTILTPLGPPDTLARIDIELTEGRPPFLYARAFVPNVVGVELRWALHELSRRRIFGWKCILLPRSRDEVIRRHGISKRMVGVRSLRVVRPAHSERCLLCEVEAFE